VNQDRQSINGHIEEYLDYYCGLNHAPGFAVLLQGQWGSGKTWFINKYRKILKDRNQKCIYVSLYGMTSFSDIEDAFFQQLHPILSSKGMAITGKILKGIIKGTLKIDLDSDKNEDGRINIQIPDINIPEYLKNTDKSILIFDDLERCKIDLSNVLGYINYFVEHQDLKVIIIANENELEKDNSYKSIKEKLIGKTFRVFPDFDGALEDFITIVNQEDVKNFLSNHTKEIQSLYEKAEHENLRNLKQIILDFERIFNALPKKAKNKTELLEHLLNMLMAFSIEIKRGSILSKDIGYLQMKYLTKGRYKMSDSTTDENGEKLTQVKTVFDRYPFLNIYDPFPSSIWWQDFFEKGIVDAPNLCQEILNSKYFEDENTPDWAKLWRFADLGDDDFNLVLKKVESSWNSFDCDEIGVVKHVCGILLVLSHHGLYFKSKNDILEYSKLYVDRLKNNNQLSLATTSIYDQVTGYRGLGFQGEDFDEFKELSSYVCEVQDLAREENMSATGLDLIDMMQSDINKFLEMIYWSHYHTNDRSIVKYHDVPILKYIEPCDFVKKILSLNDEGVSFVLHGLNERYSSNNGFGLKLIQELQWLISVKDLIEEETSNRKGKLSGFKLKTWSEKYLDEAIKNLKSTQVT
jgi:GTPase SAR1 family protein